MSREKLHQYLIDLSINNIQIKFEYDPLEVLKSELSMRSHLVCTNFGFQESEGLCVISLKVRFWGIDIVSTGKQVSEELAEVVCAIYSQPAGISVTVNSAEEIM